MPGALWICTTSNKGVLTSCLKSVRVLVYLLSYFSTHHSHKIQFFFVFAICEFFVPLIVSGNSNRGYFESKH